MRLCSTGKVQYSKRIYALIALAQIQDAREPGHQEKRVYRCPICKWWHLTSQDQRTELYDNTASI